MRIAAVIGILLIALGVIGLTYQSFTFFTHDRVVDAGPLKVDVARPHTIVFHPIVGFAALAAGVVLLLSSGRRSEI